MSARTEIPEADGLYGGISDELYHADRASLSASGAKMLLDSPRKFRYFQDNPRKPKKEFDFGHVFHRIMLGKGAEFFILDPDVHGLNKDGSPSKSPASTTMWKEAVAEARGNGQVPISVDDYNSAKAMEAEVRNHPRAGELFQRGHAEKSCYATDPDTGIKLRGRFDWLTLLDDRPTIVELKSAKDSKPDEFERDAAKFRYHMAAAWYLDLLTLAAKADDPAFIHVAVSKDQPHQVSVTEWDTESLAQGRADKRHAINTYRACLESNTWPDWTDYDPNEVHLIRIPEWRFDEVELKL